MRVSARFDAERDAVAAGDVFARVGFGVVYDADTGMLVDAAKDFDVLVTHYKRSLDYFAHELENTQIEADDQPPARSGATANSIPASDVGFTGNVSERKSSWKF